MKRWRKRKAAGERKGREVGEEMRGRRLVRELGEAGRGVYEGGKINNGRRESERSELQ